MEVEETPAAPATIVWHQYWTTDVRKAVDFYTRVFEWDIVWDPPRGKERLYGTFLSDAHRVCGFCGGDAPMPGYNPGLWSVYVYVKRMEHVMWSARLLADVSEDVPDEVPGAAAYLQDFAHAIWWLTELNPGESVAAPTLPGFFRWRRIASRWPYELMKFYREIFRWELLGDFDADDDGNRFLVFGKGSTSYGAIEYTPDHLVDVCDYVGVDDVDAFLSRVRSAGGQVVVDPMDLPNGDRIARCLDPLEGLFGLRRKASDAAARAAQLSSRPQSDLEPEFRMPPVASQRNGKYPNI